MNYLPQYFLILFLLFKTQTLFFQSSSSINGKWKICIDSVYDNPPSFVNCRYTIEFRKQGCFSIYNKTNLISYGKFQIAEFKQEFRKKLYQLEFDYEDEIEFSLESHFPKGSLVLFSDDGLEVIFVQKDSKHLASPYFLKKIQNE